MQITDDDETCLALVVRALRLKQSIAYASIKKVKTMLECAGPHDNRIRGMLNHHGATTGRWTASLVQFQNMKRPTIKHSEDAYREICEGVSREMLEICYGPVLEVISSCIRHFVHDADDEDFSDVMRPQFPAERPFLDADYSAIEARITCWLAGQEDALEEYRQGIDRYVGMAAIIYRIPPEKVNKFPQRFVGKSAILGCGFGMGAPKFRQSAQKQGGYDMPVGLEFSTVAAWRAKHKKVVSYWYDMERAAKNAILHKGKVFDVRGHIKFMVRDVEGMEFLLMRLPSGRKLAYPKPRLCGDRIAFFGNTIGTNWGDCSTWGGSLVENAVQAVAADIMANGSHRAEKEGYAIATLIHDQALAYHGEGQTSERFVELLTQLPSWAAGLPIEAEGGVVPFYKKD